MKKTLKVIDAKRAEKPPRRPKAKTTIQTLVYQELRRSLMTGVFVPGEKVTLRRVTAQIGTSVMPVREAINRLIAERALEAVGSRQVIVPVMTAEKFSEIVHWRVQLEAAAARRACQHITPEMIERLEAVHAKIVEAVEQDRRDALLRLNYEFHFLVYKTARSEILLPMIESLWLQAGPFTYFSVPSPKALWNAKHHRDLLDALKTGNGDAAGKALAEDILNSAKFLKTSGHFARPQVRNINHLTASGPAESLSG